MMRHVPKRDGPRKDSPVLMWLTIIVVMLSSVPAVAQDVPGIEICTVDKTMERRTSCLQSNVDFLVKTINRLRSDHDQKLDAANRQIAALRASVIELQKSLADIRAAKPVPAPPVPAKTETK